MTIPNIIINTNHFRVTKKLSRKPINLAITAALILPIAQAATFNVTEAQDDGTGLVANTLSWSILQSNITAGADTIELNTNVIITGVMKRLIDSDTTLQSDAIRRTIDGNNLFRPLFIKSGQVTIQDLDINNGMAKGGNAGDGGKGAGFGGGLFIYDGSVSVNQISIQNSIALGGSSGGFGGGGLFAAGVSTFGGYGGYINYQNINSTFGRGGDSGNNVPGKNGGFGGGGGQGYYDDGGDGGFGGGGGI